MRVLLDTNILLDGILQRAPWHNDADAVVQAHALGQVKCAATTLSLATVFYVARKAVGTTAARGAVRKSLATLAILPVDKQTLVDADALSGIDFEDNIIIAAAVRLPWTPSLPATWLTSHSHPFLSGSLLNC